MEEKTIEKAMQLLKQGRAVYYDLGHWDITEASTQQIAVADITKHKDGYCTVYLKDNKYGFFSIKVKIAKRQFYSGYGL